MPNPIQHFIDSRSFWAPDFCFERSALKMPKKASGCVVEGVEEGEGIEKQRSNLF